LSIAGDEDRVVTLGYGVRRRHRFSLFSVDRMTLASFGP
jgi:hypothetical protein